MMQVCHEFEVYDGLSDELAQDLMRQLMSGNRVIPAAGVRWTYRRLAPNHVGVKRWSVIARWRGRDGATPDMDESPVDGLERDTCGLHGAPVLLGGHDRPGLVRLLCLRCSRMIRVNAPPEMSRAGGVDEWRRKQREWMDYAEREWDRQCCGGGR